MKIIKSKKEEFSTEDRRNSHFTQHQVENDNNEFSADTYKDAVEYEQAADELARTSVTTSNILDKESEVVGFIMTDGARIKYNKRTHALVIYVPDKSMKTGNKIITYYKGSPQRYVAKLKYYDKELIDT